MLPFFNEEALLQPSNLIKSKETMPSTVIMTWQNQILTAIDKRYEVKKVSTFRCGLPCPVYSFKVRRSELAVVLLPIGAPVAAGFIEEYIVRGVHNFICIGYAGSLSPTTHGNLVLPTKAYRDEGTSQHYAPQEDPWIHVDSTTRLAAILDSLEVPHIEGPVWTTDAFYRETPTAVKLMKEQRCLCVDMECAANMAVARYRKVNCMQMFFSADRLENDLWETGDLKKLGSSMYEKFAEIAVRVALTTLNDES